jgi:hypothetical protein
MCVCVGVWERPFNTSFRDTIAQAITNPIYNIRDEKVERALAHFSELEGTHEYLMKTT